MSAEKVAEIKRMISYLRDPSEVAEIREHARKRVTALTSQKIQKEREDMIAHVKTLDLGEQVLVTQGKHRGEIGEIKGHGRKYIRLKFESDAKYIWKYYYNSVRHPFEEKDKTIEADMKKLNSMVNEHLGRLFK